MKFDLGPDPLKDTKRTKNLDVSRQCLSLDVELESLPCREKEISEITSFIEGSIRSGGSGDVLYISGMPGTGKTASVRWVCKQLSKSEKYQEKFHFIELNALGLSHPNEAYAAVLSKIISADAGLTAPVLKPTGAPSKSSVKPEEQETEDEEEDEALPPPTPSRAANGDGAGEVKGEYLTPRRRGGPGPKRRKNAEDAAGLLYLPTLARTPGKWKELHRFEGVLTPRQRQAIEELKLVSAMTHRQAYIKLGEYFQKDPSKRRVIVLLLDEVDYLVTKEQRVLYSFVNWPTTGKAKLAVLAVANTLDLPMRLAGRTNSRIGTNTLNFTPYTRPDLVTIARSRMQQLGKDMPFDNAALNVCAGVVSGHAGDIRRMLQVLKQAIEKADVRIAKTRREFTQLSADQKKSIAENDREHGRWISRLSPFVCSSDVQEVFKETAGNSVLSRAIVRSPLTWRLFLLAVLLARASDSVHDRWTLPNASVVVSSASVWTRWRSLCESQLGAGIDPPTVSDFSTVLQQLSLLQIIETMTAKVALEAREGKEKQGGTGGEDEENSEGEEKAPTNTGSPTKKVGGAKQNKKKGNAKASATVAAASILVGPDVADGAVENAEFMLSSTMGVVALGLNHFTDEQLKVMLKDDPDMPRLAYFEGIRAD